MHKKQTNIFNYFLLLASTVFLSSCAEVLEIDSASESELTGIWTIEHIHSDPKTQVFTKTTYDVHIEDIGSNVDLLHCKSSENMYFTRDGNLLTNQLGQRLRIVNGSIIESVDVPGVVILKKTSKTNFHDAGTVTLNSGEFGSVYQNDGVCAQRIIRSTDLTGVYHFQFSLPFENNYIEIDLEYYAIRGAQLNDPEANNIKSLTFRSPNFARYYKARSVETLNVNSEFISVSSSSMRFDFDIITALNRVFTGDNINGSIEVKY